MPGTTSTSCSTCGQLFAADGLFCPACGTPRGRDQGDPLMGAVLGERFLVVDRIGHGASGTIYRGEHVTLRRKVAIKVLHQELSRDEMAVERFRREATTVSEIDNEHIVEIHDFGRTPDDRLYLAMELLEGETLQDRLQRDRRLSVDQAVDVLIQLGEALMEAHAMGYVHRDLRPRNIYLCVRRGRADFVKLLDFGLAKLVAADGEAEATSLGMTFGDPKYMAPEQARGEALDRRADIYSMGCIAYEMLVGEPPFATGKVFDILTQQIDVVPRSPRERRSDVPPWLSAAVMRMLAKRPDDRFTTVYLVSEALRQGKATGHIMSAAVASAPEAAGGELETLPGNRTIQFGRFSPSELGSGAAAERTRGPEPAAGGVAIQPMGAEARAAADGAATQPMGTEPPTEPVAIEPVALAARPAASAGTSTSGARPAGGAASGAAGDEPGDAERHAADDDGEDARAAVSGARGGKGRGGKGRGGKASIRPEDSVAGISQAWFADGEGVDDDLDEGQRARLDEARDNVSLGGESLTGDDLYYDPGRRPIVKIAAIGGGVLLLLVVLALAWPSGKKDRPPESSTEDPRAQAATALAAVEAIDAAAPAPVDAGVADAAPAAAVVQPGQGEDAAPKPGGDATRAAGSAAKVQTGVRSSGTSSGSTRSSGTSSTRTADELRDPFTDGTSGPRRGGSGSSRPADELQDPFAGGGSGSSGDSSKANQAAFFAKLGQSDLRSGNVGGAANNFNKALELDARSVDAVIGLGEVALQTGSYSAAISHLKKAARMSPRNALAHTLLGEAYLNSGKASLAEASFKQALKLDPDSARARTGYNEAAGRIPPPADDP